MIPSMTDGVESVFIDAIIAKASVSNLDRSIQRQLARLDKTQFHAMIISPLVSALQANSCLVSSYRRRIAEEHFYIAKSA